MNQYNLKIFNLHYRRAQTRNAIDYYYMDMELLEYILYSRNSLGFFHLFSRFGYLYI